MKKIFTILSCIAITSAVSAQNYSTSTSTGTADPYAYNNAGTAVLAIPSLDVLSSAQTIPFSFNFYGSAVTSYKASDNGYITFDAAATTSDPANAAIPSAGGPNNAIYAFWDDLGVISGSGSPDEVVSFNYGTAPNRVHVIQWYSVTPASGTGFLYAAIRLYECGDFDIVLNYGNASGMTGTVGCENAAGSAGTMAEGPSFSYPGVGSVGNDDVVYSFFWDGITTDAAITASDLSGMVSVGNNTVSGEISNYGSAPITSYDLNYSIDGGTAVTDNITGVNIATGASTTFSHATPWNIPAGGANHTICIWADNINGNADERTCNDQICEDVFSANGTGASNVAVVVEEFSGAWCGWCVDGAVVLEDMLTSYPGEIIGVTVHDNDDMEYAEGIRSAFGVTAYPNALIDRFVFPGEADEPHSRSAWEANAVSRLGKYTPVEVGVSHSYDAATRTITATVTADYVDYASGDMRFNLEITEDGVTGTGSGYDQVNFTNTTAGHPYEGAGDPIVGFVHNHVLRANPGGAYGNSGVIPSTVSPGSTYSETFTYVIPATYDETKINIVGFVNYYSTTIGEREIMNADESPLSAASINENTLFAGFTVAPNPVKGDFSLVLDLRQEIKADIVIYNMNGQKVGNIASGTYAAGEHKIGANTGDLMAGIYYVTVITEKGSFTEKLVIR